MPRYAVLIRPAANRVFGGVAADLLRHEISLAAGLTAAGALGELTTATLGGVEYVTFEAIEPLRPGTAVAAVVANGSSTYAVFERLDGDGDGDGGRDELLRPVALPRFDRFDDDLVTTQRYVGKTNEALTKLLVNLGLAAADGAMAALLAGQRVRVLDPLCGRGTTLNQALLYGTDALGLDVDAKDTAAYATFLKTWLQEKRVKHQLDGTAGRHRFRVTIGQKGAAAADRRQVVDVVTGDTTAAAELFGRNSVDVVVADLPYGVQHGARTDAGDLVRRPGALVETAAPAWRAALRPGGAMALAWNVRVLSRAELTASLTAAGLDVLEPREATGFEHRVDRTITRDVVVARRPVAG